VVGPVPSQRWTTENTDDTNVLMGPKGQSNVPGICTNSSTNL
jgi:hypothetical protein